MRPVVDRLPTPGIAATHDGVPDYADAFEVRIDRPDHRSAEQWARCALERAPTVVRRVVVVAHRGVLRFRLGPLRSSDHVLGWQIRDSHPDTIELAAEGPLMSGLIVGRRTSPTTTQIETFVFFHRRSAATIWTLVGPLHRRIAPLLLKRAASDE
jgi:hypothetical protein